MRVQMDTVKGSEVRRQLTTGFFIRTGMAFASALDLPASKANADSRVMATLLDTNINIPSIGAILDNANYKDWIVVDRRILPYNALQYQIIVIYRWLGAIQQRDHTSLQQTTSVLNPKTKKPIYNTWTDPDDATIKITRLCHFRDFLPIRNYTVTKTQRFADSVAILNSRKCVNSSQWYGLPVGSWLVTDIDGTSLDGGITFTYSVTFTTQTEYDWAQYDIMRDDRGREIYVDPVKYNTLLSKSYTYGAEDNTTCPGVVRADRFKTIDFPTVFGLNFP